jgi:hypothetical protein
LLPNSIATPFDVTSRLKNYASHWISDRFILEAINRLAAQEQVQPGTALRDNDLTRLNGFFST